MGVDVYLLNRAGAILEIGGLAKRVGTLRRLSKWTEMNACREAEMQELQAAVQNKRMPPAVLAWGTDMRLIDASRHRADGRVVLAWEAGRSYVSDTNLDRLPVLGYALKDNSSGRYVLHEERGSCFIPVSLEAAKKTGILDERGRLVRQMAPEILDCRSVAENRDLRTVVADCILSNGERCEIWTAIEEENVPAADWYVGKRPGEVRRFATTCIV